jgi:hypothetical protein
MLIGQQSFFKQIFFIILLLSSLCSFSQSDKDTLKANSIIIKKNIHEINYQVPFLFGYSYFHNFGNHVVPGVGLKFGYGWAYSVRFFNLGADYLTDKGLILEFLECDIKIRDAFAKQKLSRWNSYDLGISYMAILPSIEEDWVQVLSLEFSFQARIYKVIRLGASVYIGDPISYSQMDLFFSIYPSLIISF